MKEDGTKKNSEKKSARKTETVVSALKKKAYGYVSTEVVEEYGESGDGNIVLVKKKVTKKDVPPDLSAIKILIESSEEQSVESMTDEQLDKEKTRLLKLLRESEEKDGKVNAVDSEVEKI